jgi:hypothetical protein
MKPSILENKDFWSGVLLIALGAVATFIARGYRFGNALHMGPGYFPIVLGVLLILFGLYFTGRSLRSSERIEGSLSLRALVALPASLALFGLLIDRAGFVPAMLVLIFGSALGSTQFRFVEVLLFSLLLTVLAVAVFIWGLGLPYPLFAEF